MRPYLAGTRRWRTRRFFFVDLLSSRKKHRHITAHRNVDSHWFRAALVRKVLCQPLAQLACVAANDIVLKRAIIRRPVEDMHADLVLCDLVSPPFQGFCHHKQQKLRKQGGAGEVRPCDHTLRQGPMRVFLQTRSPCLLERKHLGLGLDGCNLIHEPYLQAAIQGRRAVSGSTVKE